MTQTSATRTETNREIIRQAFDAWRQGTGTITGVFALDMVWRIEGHSAASKEYHTCVPRNSVVLEEPAG